MKTIFRTLILFVFVLVTNASSIMPPPEKWDMLLGRWEVLAYSEQGIQVSKKLPSLPQAIKVWQYVSRNRAISFYGYDPEGEGKQPRSFSRWQERDSVAEVRRVSEAISMPYFAVFFADSTLACYNKDTLTQVVQFPETYRFVYSPEKTSLPILYPGSVFPRWRAQIVRLDATRLTLFLPEEGELVELQKTAFSLP